MKNDNTDNLNDRNKQKQNICTGYKPMIGKKETYWNHGRFHRRKNEQGPKY